MRQTLAVGRLWDIRVGVHVSWLAVFAFMTLALAHALPMLPPPQALGFGALCALALFAGVVAHEFAHALAARRWGVRTDAITLFLFGGVATLEREPASPRADALVAAAGPAMSAVLAMVAVGLTIAAERVVPGRPGAALGVLGTYLALANAVLAGFNLLPAYPMDGGRILRALVWARTGDRAGATRLASRVGMAFALAFVTAGVALALAFHEPSYGWYVLLGGFLLRQGWSYERTLRRSRPRAPRGIVSAA